MPLSLRRTLRELWTRPLQAHWVLDLPAAELSQVVHLLYMALCEALGLVEADQVLTRGARRRAGPAGAAVLAAPAALSPGRDQAAAGPIRASMSAAAA